MQRTVDFSEIERTIVFILPDEDSRPICLDAFLESAREAQAHGSNKWGVHYLRDRIRLLVGNIIVLTLHQGGVWLALDKEILDESESKRNRLKASGSWKWDTGNDAEYRAIPSRNGYYFPGDDHVEIWPVIRGLHFELIRKTAEKYKKLQRRSQAQHTQRVLEYVGAQLGQSVPKPMYGPSMEEDSKLAEEIPENADFPEGSKKRITVNRYERDPRARRKCVAYHGTTCCICGFDFGQTYGEAGQGFIHVHHLKPLAEIGEGYRVNAVDDLVPVCPNCHAIIHRGGSIRTIKEVKNLLSAVDEK